MIGIKIIALAFLHSTVYAATLTTETVAPAASMRAYTLTTTPSTPLLINDKQNVVIDGVKISNPSGNCIEINRSTNVTIKNSEIGPCKGIGIEANNSRQITIEKNNIVKTEINIATNDVNNVLIQGNYIDTGENNLNINRSSGVKIILNFGTNFMGPYPRGHFIQFDNVSGEGNEIICNTADAYPGMPDPVTFGETPYIRVEDIISLWQTNGTANSPIFVAYNRMRGGSSRTASGIMLGDGAGSYQTAYKNVVVNPWNTGISVAGGNNMRVAANKIFSNLPGQVAGSGMYINNFYPQYDSCYGITHDQNLLRWTTGGQYTNELWNSNNCSNITGLETNNLKATYLTENIFNEPIAECKAIASSKGYRLSGWE